MTADDDLRRAWAEYTLRFADPDDPTRHSETRIRDAFAAGWDAALAARPEPRVWPQSESHYDATWQKPDPTVSEPRAEGLREALQAIIDLRVVVSDHPHGGVHPPYLEWLKVADIARRALAATPPAEGLDADRLRDAIAETVDTTTAQRVLPYLDIIAMAYLRHLREGT